MAITASLSLVLLLAVIGLKVTGRLSWPGLIASVLLGASLAGLFLPVLDALATGLQSASGFFDDATR